MFNSWLIEKKSVESLTNLGNLTNLEMVERHRASFNGKIAQMQDAASKNSKFMTRADQVPTYGLGTLNLPADVISSLETEEDLLISGKKAARFEIYDDSNAL